jgi:CMP-N-acetylneuraminic acid synthetase/2-polyprenyl-3-methyl-5-hydroxy-6-metoxy-1,4-benzoquinol methylase
MKNIIAIIPARGGSKGIKKKNIRLIDGQPLIYYPIKAASQSKYISRVIVSTDDNEIADIAIRYPGVEMIKRPPDISGDFSKSEETLIHAVETIEKREEPVDLIVFLQATSPLNKTAYIDQCIEKISEGYDSVFCAIEDYGFFHGEKLLLDRPMRQQREPRIRETGNCWVIKKTALLASKNRLSGNIGYVLIDKWDALEIDEPEDLEYIRPIVEKRNRQEHHQYYVKRETSNKPDYETSYWGKTIDPDGQPRNKLKEKQQYIEDTKEIISYINSLPGGKMLDIGCGFGFLLSAIDEKWKKNGLEISEYAANIAKQYGDIFVGDLYKANYKDESFDLITLYHVIEHLEDPASFVKKINNLLKIGGKFIVSTPDFKSITAQRFKENFRLLHDSTHISLFSTETLTALLKDTGFEIETITHPYFDSRHFTLDNLERLFDTSQVSPAFYGNVVNIYAYKC